MDIYLVKATLPQYCIGFTIGNKVVLNEAFSESEGKYYSALLIDRIRSGYGDCIKQFDNNHDVETVRIDNLA